MKKVITLEEILKLSKESTKIKKQNKNVKITNKNKNSISILENLGFLINKYEKTENDEFGASNLYYCQFEDWIFLIHEIENGPMIITESRNIKTGDKLNFYCDAKCEETNEYRIKEFIKIMKEGNEKYLKEKYQHLKKIPDKFKSYGYDVQVEREIINLNTCDVKMIIDERYCLRIRKDEKEIPKIYIKNYKNRYNYQLGEVDEKQEYEFLYESEHDFIELEKCMIAFEEEVNGIYGYYEDGKYYKNMIIENLFSVIEEQLKNEKVEDSKVINVKTFFDHYKGIEIYNEYYIYFRNKSKNNERYRIIFEYDKRKDDRYCILTILSEIKHEEKTFINENKCEIKGSFRTLYWKLRDFLWEMYKIHKIDLEK